MLCLCYNVIMDWLIDWVNYVYNSIMYNVITWKVFELYYINYKIDIISIIKSVFYVINWVIETWKNDEKWRKLTKIEQHTISDTFRTRFRTTFWGRFWVDFGSILGHFLKMADLRWENDLFWREKWPILKGKVTVFPW